MGGISLESWPILGAFLFLQSVITIPLILYIRSAHEKQIQFMQKLYDTAQDERIALAKQVETNSERMWKFTDAITELREAVRDLGRERRTP